MITLFLFDLQQVVSVHITVGHLHQIHDHKANFWSFMICYAYLDQKVQAICWCLK